MERKKFVCTGNCLECLPAQRAYCASQHSYSNMQVLDKMMDELLTMKRYVNALYEKIDSIQSNEASVFDPHMNDVGEDMIQVEEGDEEE